MTQENLVVVGADSETRLIAHGNLVPELICVTASDGAPEPDNQIAAVADPDDRLEALVDSIFDESVVSVWHNAAFDIPVILRRFPEKVTHIFNMLEKGRIKCTKVREKLLWLAVSGSIKTLDMGNGITMPGDFSLAGLVKRYFNEDLSQSKTLADSWRINYDKLEKESSSEWPKDAIAYAVDDAVWAKRCYDEQEAWRAKIIKERGFDPIKVEDFQVLADVCLRFWSAAAIEIDAEEHQRISERVGELLKPENLSLLYSSGIVRPAVPPQPYARDVREHVEGCSGNKGCDCPPKMTAGSPESRNMKVLNQYVLDLAKAKPDQVELRYTEPSKKFPEGQLSINEEWLADHEGVDELLDQYALRSKYQKLVSTELPRMCIKDEHGNPTSISPFVHANYDVLKETGRTSSYGSEDYPSLNIQNIASSFGEGLHPRECIVAPPGYLIYSIDYSFMELVTFAQTCLNLFGYSRLAEIINSGKDPHAWLGSQICARADSDFQKLVLRENGIDAEDQEKVYEIFTAMKGCGEEAWEKTFKKYRTLAKPTGLGYPGGLMPPTLIKYAKSTFQTIIDLETSTMLRNVWLAALPEAQEYFNYINHEMVDEFNRGRAKKDKKGNLLPVRDTYRYTTPLGMVRSHCTYCAAANGMGLQSPSAEGAKAGLIVVTRKAYDPGFGSPLFGNIIPWGFIHDEQLGYVVDNEHTTEYCEDIAGTMVETFRLVAPDVKIKAEPVLMRRWDKGAEPVRDGSGKLVPWEPKVKESRNGNSDSKEGGEAGDPDDEDPGGGSDSPGGHGVKHRDRDSGLASDQPVQHSRGADRGSQARQGSGGPGATGQGSGEDHRVDAGDLQLVPEHGASAEGQGLPSESRVDQRREKSRCSSPSREVIANLPSEKSEGEVFDGIRAWRSTVGKCKNSKGEWYPAANGGKGDWLQEGDFVVSPYTKNGEHYCARYRDGTIVGAGDPYEAMATCLEIENEYSTARRVIRLTPAF